MNLPDLGVGITFSLELEPFIKSNLDLIRVLMIEPQTFWFHTNKESESFKEDPDAIKKIRSLPCHKVVHGVSSPVGGVTLPDPLQIPLFTRIVDDLRSPWASEHLSFNNVQSVQGGFKTGFFLPPRQTPAGVQHSIKSIRALANNLPVPLAVETGVNYLRCRKDELSDGEFVSRVVRGADTGIVLDLHNLWTNEFNSRQSIEEFLDEIPLDRVWEIHLAGGNEEDGFWLDAHSGAMPEKLIERSRKVVPRLSNLHAIVFEIYPSYLSEIGPDTIRNQLKVLWQLWNSRSKSERITKFCNLSSSDPNSDEEKRMDGHFTPLDWEYTLGSLVISRQVPGELAMELSVDPAIPVYRKLIQSFRASMIVGALPMTSRLLIHALKEEFNSLLKDFWDKTAPELFSSDEAENFIEFVKYRKLDVLFLEDIMEFERAVIRSRIENRSTTLIMKYDLIRVLDSLQQRHPPREPKKGTFRIDIIPNRITSTNVSDNEGGILNYAHPTERNWNH